jgi:hypothetical protein
LTLLERVGVEDGQPIPLAWGFEKCAPISAIEVYPAVTRLAHKAPDKGGSLDGLSSCIAFESGISVAVLTADAVDAAVCVLAAADFVLGRTLGPRDLPLAQVEGWIWAP